MQPRFRLSQLPSRKNLPKSGVYLLTFPNKKVYIGCSFSNRPQACIWHRLHSYRVLSCKSQGKLLAALKKYKHSDIIVDILVISNDPETTLSAEMDFIKNYQSHGKNGYNILIGGRLGSFGLTVSEETREKISKKLRGRKMSEKCKIALKKWREQELENIVDLGCGVKYRHNASNLISIEDMKRIVLTCAKERNERILRKKQRMKNQC